MSVVYIKMYSGEDILATMATETENDIVITNPLIVITQMSGTRNRMITSIYPWVPIRELMAADYHLDKSATIAIMKIPEYVLTNYNRIITEIHSENDSDTSESMQNEIDDVQLINRTLH